MTDRRQQHMAVLADEIRACRRCEGMMSLGRLRRRRAMGRCDLWSWLSGTAFVVGQSLCRRWVASQIPFTGGSGRVIDAGLALAGIAKDQIFITNVVHCHPRGDRESFPEEIEKCSRYLHRELEIVQPRLIVGLVRDAEAVLRPAYPDARELSWPFVSAPVRRPRATLSPDLLFPNHRSWVKWQPKYIHEEYVTCLASALEWGLCGQRRPGR